jgi:hypothetical protein
MSSAVNNPKDLDRGRTRSPADNGYIHEVVAGELVMSPEQLSAQAFSPACSFRGAFNRQHRLGAVWDPALAVGCRTGIVVLGRFLHSQSQVAQPGFHSSTRKFSRAPDLAVEILPGNTRAEIDERLKDFFASGTQIAWIVIPTTSPSRSVIRPPIGDCAARRDVEGNTFCPASSSPSPISSRDGTGLRGGREAEGGRYQRCSTNTLNFRRSKWAMGCGLTFSFPL